MNQILTLPILDQILDTLVQDETCVTKESFHKLKNSILAQYSIKDGPTSIELLAQYEAGIRSGRYTPSLRVKKILRKRAVRSLSGVAVISLLTKFWGCPGKCIYCPTYEGLPKSYISDEPAVQRAEMNDFDPFLQVQNRLTSLSMTGNAISKCDVRIIGGTWSVYPREYREDFLKNIYDAHTAFDSSQLMIQSSQSEKGNPFSSGTIQQSNNPTFQLSTTLEEAKKRNETASSRVIGIAIETRPDWIDEEEIILLRSYGITRVEIGYQTTDDTINELNKRGHGNKESIRATELLKDAGFKVVAHMMPGLVGATPEVDRIAMREVFDNPAYRPDEIKIYPLVVTPNSELTDMWERGEFVPYDDATLIPLMAELQSYLPEYVRLNRMYRDIPAHEILAGSKLANLRQITEAHMIARGLARRDISAREIRAKDNNPLDAVLDVSFYEASGGHEWFVQMIDSLDRTLFGLCRLRVPSTYFTGLPHIIDVLDGAAIIRELHVFGDQIAVGGMSDNTGQHMGFGKKMLEWCEQKIREDYPHCAKMAVIAGVGVRAYYEKRGYKLENEYMIKYLDR